MKHGKGRESDERRRSAGSTGSDKGNSNEKLLAAFSPAMQTAKMLSKNAFIKHGEDENLFKIQSISKRGQHASLLMSAKRC